MFRQPVCPSGSRDVERKININMGDRINKLDVPASSPKATSVRPDALATSRSEEANGPTEHESSFKDSHERSAVKIATIIGARPQFVKAAAISFALRAYSLPANRLPLNEVIIHTGQHYDYEMSQKFFEELDIPEPDYNLEVGSASQGLQTAKMLERIEEILLKEKPSLVLVYGDTNSTMAGALAAVKLHIPVAHVEAGMRSFNRSMPEEINRVVTDHVSSILFCSTPTAVDNLRREGFSNIINYEESPNSQQRIVNSEIPFVINVGDVMYDIALKSIAIAEHKSNILSSLKAKSYKLEAKSYYLATVHRQSNTDNLDNLRSILDALSQLDLPVIFPVHPRTKKAIDFLSMSQEPRAMSQNVHFIAPVGYLDMIQLERNAKAILTDSGGVQKEAYFYKVPCITLRDETEWVETVESGWNTLVGPSTEKIVSTVRNLRIPASSGDLYGDGKAAEKIVNILANSSWQKTKPLQPRRLNLVG